MNTSISTHQPHRRIKSPARASSPRPARPGRRYAACSTTSQSGKFRRATTGCWKYKVKQDLVQATAHKIAQIRIEEVGVKLAD